MTLQEFFQVCLENPEIPVFYFVAVPLTALLAGIFSRGDGEISPWKYLYAALMYFAFVPGIFAITLNLYLFLFERQSIWNIDLVMQVLPVVSMLITLWLITKYVDLNAIPGFGKISGLILMILVLLSLLWIVDRTHILVISVLPFTTFLIIFVLMIVLFRYGWKWLFENS